MHMNENHISMLNVSSPVKNPEGVKDCAKVYAHVCVCVCVNESFITIKEEVRKKWSKIEIVCVCLYVAQRGKSVED